MSKPTTFPLPRPPNKAERKATKAARKEKNARPAGPARLTGEMFAAPDGSLSLKVGDRLLGGVVTSVTFTPSRDVKDGGNEKAAGVSDE